MTNKKGFHDDLELASSDSTKICPGCLAQGVFIVRVMYYSLSYILIAAFTPLLASYIFSNRSSVCIDQSHQLSNQMPSLDHPTSHDAMSFRSYLR